MDRFPFFEVLTKKMPTYFVYYKTTQQAIFPYQLVTSAVTTTTYYDTL